MCANTKLAIAPHHGGIRAVNIKQRSSMCDNTRLLPLSAIEQAVDDWGEIK
jgi:hypothetical protein